MLLTKEVFQAGGQMASPKRETGQWHPLEKQAVVPNFSDLTLWEQLPLELSRGGAGA